MRGVYPVEQIKAAEQALMKALPEGALMQRAASGLATECARLLGAVYGARVVLLVGGGNNGGDGLYAGAALARRGARVEAVLLDPDRAHAGGLAALLGAGGLISGTDGAAIGRADLVLDAITGIGGSGGLREPAATLAALAQASTALLVAVDIPSGVDADTGVVEGQAVQADVTITFGALKPGLVAGAGAQHCGTVYTVDIGLDLPGAGLEVLEAADVGHHLHPPGPLDDKYTRGVVGVCAGSAQYSGAAVLCTGAALHGGAGMVRYAGAAADAVRARWPETVVTDLADAGRAQAWVIGPGLGTGDAGLAALRHVLGLDVPVLVDADAITLLAQHRELLEARSAPTVLTPHDREFERMFGEVGEDRIGAARRAAADCAAVVLLKGNATVIAAPDGHAYVNRTGTPWLGTAGSGDVLSGLAGSMLAAGHPAALAAALAAFVHGLAGQVAAVDGPPTAFDVLTAIRPALHTLEGGPGLAHSQR